MTQWLLPHPPDVYVTRLTALEERIQRALLAQRGEPAASASDVVREGAAGTSYAGDTIYRIDVHSEEALLDFCDEWARTLDYPFVLVAEGLPGDGRRVYPGSAGPADALFECIVDPIDGTRGLMYDKRSAWALAGVAPGAALLGQRPTLADVVVAVQTELPTSRARLADTLWAVAGAGTHGQTRDLVTGDRRPARPAPSSAATLAHGFATVAKFFPGTKELASWLEERLFAEVVGEHAAGAPLVFDDEYISSGGQLYELAMGHDRFVADLRPVLLDAQEARALGRAARPADEKARGVRRLCARPYDLCTALIAQEAGVAVTDAWGHRLAAPLDTKSDVAWVGYANARLRERIEPALQRLLREMGAPEPAAAASGSGATAS